MTFPGPGLPEAPRRNPYEDLLQQIRELRERVQFLEAHAEGGTTLNASATPTANYLLYLNGSAVWPADVTDFGSLTLDAMVYMPSLWQDQTAWAMAANNNWQQDTQSTSITLRRKSDVLVLSDIAWNNSTAARINGQAFRWTLGGAAVTGQSTGTGNIGNTVSTVEHHFVGEQFLAQAAGTFTLQLEAQKTQAAFAADTVNIFYRIAIVVVIPVD